MKLFKSLFICIIILISVSANAWQEKFISDLKNGGAYVVAQDGKVLFEHRADDNFIPASISKVAISAAALKVLGADYRFKTEFFQTKDGCIAVKGYGDPFFVSEEIEAAALGIKTRGVGAASCIIVDTSYFAPNIATDGASESNDPYNALNGALIANFNTVFVQRSGSQIVTAEPQTPLTKIARARAMSAPAGKQRVNLGADPQQGALYAGELIAAFLNRNGVRVDGDVRLGGVPPGSRLVYTHISSKRLADVIRSCLEFSTNFIANQLFLVLGAQVHGAPATPDKGVDVLQSFLKRDVGWQRAAMFDGAGLSRKNSVTPKQMVELLKYFEPNKDLLPMEKGKFLAKTGTLNSVNTLVGFFNSPKFGLCRFAILVNSPVPFDYKFRMAEEMYRGVLGSSIQ